MKYKLLLFSALTAILSVITFLIVLPSMPIDSKQLMLFHEQKSIRSQPIMQKPLKTTTTLAAVGDILIHSPLYKDARTKEGYNFKPMFEQVKDYISQAHVAVANQETMIGGTNIGLSTYPSFNSPYEVGDALKAAGIDMVTIANNHTLDRGIPAITNAIDHWNEIDMPYTGSFSSENDRNKIRTIESNGITLSFLAYTYGTNGIPIPDDKDYLVNMIDLPLMKQDIQKAKKMSDVVVVSLHFGNQYEQLPNNRQKKLVKQLANEGVNIIIGHHPHVLQPFEWVEGNSGSKTFVAYSLGNFLSGQDGIYKNIGGILQLQIEKTGLVDRSEITIKQPRFIPTWVHSKHDRDYKVVPLENAGDHGLKNADKLYKEIQQHMRRWMPEVTF